MSPTASPRPRPSRSTLGTLFDIYGDEVTPSKAKRVPAVRTGPRRGCSSSSSDGAEEPSTLSQRDWDRFIRARRAGSIGPSGKPVSDRDCSNTT